MHGCVLSTVATDTLVQKHWSNPIEWDTDSNLMMSNLKWIWMATVSAVLLKYSFYWNSFTTKYYLYSE